MEKVKTNNKKKLIVMAIAIALFAFVGIGYAIYTEVINVSGTGTVGGSTFSLEVTEVAETVGADLGVGTIGEDKLSVSFDITAVKPGDTYTATITVTNTGSLAAKYKGITPAEANTAQTQYVTYGLTTTTAVDTQINANGTQTFTFTFAWSSEDTTEYTQSVKYNFTFTINYEQA